MNMLKEACYRYPIVAFLAVSFTFTWAIWFGSVLFEDDWGIRKIITGMGFGPAIAAILLSMLRGKQCVVHSGKWWMWFGASFFILLMSYLSILVTGDAIAANDFAHAEPPGFSAINITLCLISAGIGAFIVAATFGGEAPVYSGYIGFRKSWRWVLLAAFLPSIWFVAGLTVAYFQNKEIIDVFGGLETLFWVFYVVRSVIFTLMVVAIGEELGWRGWLLPALQEKFSPLLSSLFVGIVWGGWHFPLYVIGAYDEPPHMVFVKVGVCVFLSVLFTYFHNRSMGNVLVAVLLHTAMNSTQRFIPVTEAMGIFMMLTIFALPFVARMWRKD